MSSLRFHQTEAAECGLMCLAHASSKLGATLDVIALRRRHPGSIRGLTLRQLVDLASAMGMLARAVQCPASEIRELKLPAILHWSFNHYVVLERCNGRDVTVFDPGRGIMQIPILEFGKQYTGIALELSRAPNFTRRREPSPLNIWSWIRPHPIMRNGLGQLLILSLLLQLYTLGSPFYLQLAIDQVVQKTDSSLLVTLAVGFGLFGIYNVAATLLRGLVSQQLSAHIGWDMMIRLYRHLIRLPLPWFQKRRLADTISRFDAINPIRDLVSGGLIGTAIDGLLGVATFIMLAAFNWKIAIWVIFSLALFVVTRLVTLPRLLRLTSEAFTAHIAENGKRIETLRAIQTIKAMSAEASQEAQWANRLADVTRTNLSSGRFQAYCKALNQLYDTISSTVIIFLCASSALRGEMTIGMVYAFLMYRTQFSTSTINIVEQIIQWRLADVYSLRLADIVLTEKERGLDDFYTENAAVRGAIDVASVSFRYSVNDPIVLDDVSFSIKPGEFVAIVGPSGVGKSTLLKLLSGLYQPTTGAVTLDGRSLTDWGPRAVRDAFGIVLQDDELLSGSITDNVAFFSERVEMDEIWAALEAAALADEVRAMPMQAETYVGDMGSALSGGQKQRLLIARALFKRPKLLLMDEATSHLDVENEKKINIAIQSLNITRVVVAHRRETISAADRIIKLS